MMLTLDVKQEPFTIKAECPTIVTPGKEIVIRLNLNVYSQVEFISLSWKTPPSLVQAIPSVQFPLSIGTNTTLDIIQSFKTDVNREDFGEIEATLTYRTPSSSQNFIVTWRHWITIFKRVTESDAAKLSSDSRSKLVEVVNARLINGFLYLADFVRFFDHYLNIEIPGPLAAGISKELNLTQQDLPVDEEMFYRIAIGEVSYYGIEKFELIPEEECEESDDRFDPDEMKEVQHPVVDI
jgi:hypothetical protein